MLTLIREIEQRRAEEGKSTAALSPESSSSSVISASPETQRPRGRLKGKAGKGGKGGKGKTSGEETGKTSLMASDRRLRPR